MTSGFLVLLPIDLSPDHGGDEDHPLPDETPDAIADDDDEEEEEDTDRCLTRAA